MRFFWQPKTAPTLAMLVTAQDDTVRLLARLIDNLQTRAANTEGDMRPLVGRVDVLEGRDYSTMGSPRGESFQQLHNQIDLLNRKVAAIQALLREREEEEAAVG